MIKVQNLSKSFAQTKAVSQISFEIKTGEIVGFLGPNGAGKSTTMKMITGFCVPDSGSIQIGEFDLLKNPQQAKALIGYLPESSALYQDMIVYDHLVYFAKLRGVASQNQKQRIQTVCEQCGLLGVLSKRVSELSKGFKQRVGLALALIHDPQVLILDEPTVGLDPNQIVEIRSLIQNIAKTKTVFISSHILSEVAATCHRVLILKSGQIVAQGTPKDLMSESSDNVAYKVCLKASSTQMEKAVARLSGVKRVDTKSAGQNLVEAEFTFSEESAENIFDWAVQEDFKILHLEKQKNSLESVFHKLTKD